MKRLILLSGFLSIVFNLFAEPLRIATDHWPPYEDIHNKAARGYSVDVVEAVFKRMKQPVAIQEYPWARGVKNVYTGKSNALMSASYTNERNEKCFFPAEPLLTSKYVLFIRAENANKFKFDTYDDLLGKSIGVIRGFGYSDEFWTFVKKHKSYQTVKNGKSNIKKIMKNRIDYFADDLGVGLAMIKKMGLERKIIPLKKSIKEVGLNIIFSRKTTEKTFVDSFTKELQAFKKTPEFRLIQKKYLGN